MTSDTDDRGQQVTTAIRMQRMGSSLGHMAAEHQRLAEERAQLEREIEQLQRGLPDGAMDVVRRANEILAAHDEKLSKLRAARDQLDARLGVSEQERRAEAEQRRHEEIAADRRRLVEAVDGVLRHVADAQEHLCAFVENVNAALAAHQEARATAARLSGGARLPVGFSVVDLVNRLGGSLSGALAAIRVPGALPGGTVRIGPLDLPSSPHAADGDWRERERRVMAPAVHQLINEEGN